MNLTANGNTLLKTDPGKLYVFAAQGTFGGGTLALQFSLDGGTTWTTFSDSSTSASLTTAGGRLIVAPSTNVRLNLTGATSPAINAFLTEAI